MIMKESISYLSIILTIIAYVPYFRSVFNHKTTAHLFSWIVWTLVNGIAFAGQWSRGGGAGAWVTAFTMLVCFSVTVLSLFFGEKNVTKSDIASFIGALLAILLWCLEGDPLGAVILATLIDILGCYPTFRKSWFKPYGEPIFPWIVCSLRSALSLFALEHYSVVTVIYPLAVTFLNMVLALVLIYRRKVQPV